MVESQAFAPRIQTHDDNSLQTPFLHFKMLRSFHYMHYNYKNKDLRTNGAKPMTFKETRMI